MTIHVLINCYWSSGISGGDRRTLEILRRWKDTEKYRFIVYTTVAFHELMVREGISHLTVKRIDDNRTKKNNIVLEYLIRTKDCIREIKKTIKRGDVLYSTTDILPDVIPAAYFKIQAKSKCRWTMISYHVFESFYRRPGNILVNFMSCYQQKYAMFLGKKYADAYMTTSPLVYEYMQKHKYNMDKVIMTDNAVDIELIDSSNLSVEGYDACFLARLNPSKGIYELPQIWKKVIKQFPNAKLAIMGHGTDEIVSRLECAIKEEGMEKHIVLLGFLESNHAFSIMKNSKLFLFTSHEEGWGMAVAEALVCNLPVVTYDLPIYRHLFKKGVIGCKMLDLDEMAENVIHLLSNEQYAKMVGMAGGEYIREHYSLDVIAKKELEILLSTIKLRDTL